MQAMQAPILVLTALAAMTLQLAAGAPATVTETPFSSCEESKDPISLRVRGCSQQPCHMPKGQVGSMEADFVVDADVAQLDTVVTAFVFGSKIDFPLKQKNACRALTNAECPLDQHESVTFKFELDVDKSYPSIALPVEVALKDKGGRSYMCFKLNLVVVDP